MTNPEDLWYEGTLCCDYQFCYCCCGDCELYEKGVTNLGIHECEHFEEL